MNQFTTFKQITKLDYHGNEYTATVIDDLKRDLGKLWKEFAERFNNQQARGPGQISDRWVQRQADKELNDKENL